MQRHTRPRVKWRTINRCGRGRKKGTVREVLHVLLSLCAVHSDGESARGVGGGGALGSQRVGEATREGRENSASAREFCSAESQ